MLERMRWRALSLAIINATSSLSSRLRPSTILSIIPCSYHTVHSFPRSTNGCDSTTSKSKNIAGEEKYSSTVFNDFVSVHPTSIIHKGAIIGEDVVIGPFCTVGSAVKLGKGCVLHPNSHVLGRSELGEGCILRSGAIVGADVPGCTIVGKENSFGHYAVVGVKCQDLKYKGGEDCHLQIGDKNDIREYVSIHRSSKASEQTTVGSGNLIMGACHIAHDCKLGNGNILANGTLLGGHVILQDHVHTGGGVAVHQRCQIDSYAFVAGGSMVVRDIPMYTMVSGDRAELCGLNLEGLRRHKFCDNEVRLIKKAYQKLFMNIDGKLGSRLAILESSEEMMSMPAVVHMLSSVRSCFEENRRGICNFGRWKCE